jgi:DNA-directed RNA polymerase specialized sigma24 family protein
VSESYDTQVLIRDACDGDQQSIRRLLVIYHPRLRARLLRQMDATMRSKIEPEDILQQVYLETFRAIGQFEYQGKDSFLRWMYAILDRKLIDEHRAMRADRRDVRRDGHAGVHRHHRPAAHHAHGDGHRR